MNCRSVRSLVKPALLTLSGVVLLVSITLTTNAKPKTNFPSNLGASDSAAHFVNAKEARRIVIRLINRKAKGNLKGAANLSASCSCAAAPDEWGFGGFGTCFSGCLQSWGIGYGSLTTCSGICGLAATGNPVGIAGCAACLGTAEWIVMGCSLHCLYKETRWGSLETVKSRHSRTRGSQQARLTAKRVTSG
jgi:hypothetical protein